VFCAGCSDDLIDCVERTARLSLDNGCWIADSVTTTGGCTATWGEPDAANAAAGCAYSGVVTPVADGPCTVRVDLKNRGAFEAVVNVTSISEGVCRGEYAHGGQLTPVDAAAADAGPDGG
jgi:hypothetical protein